MNKYYTPDYKEFHVGFEYENFVKNIGWTKRTLESLGDQSVNETNACLDYEDYRVKFLDKQDIEALGWKNPTDYQNCIVYHNRDRLLIHYQKDNLVGITDIVGSVSSKYDWDTLHYLFNGKIKNKSELKKLMEQLTITP